MLKTTAALGCAVAAPGTLLWGVKTLTDRRFNNPSTSPRRGMYCRGMFATPLPWLKPLEGSCNNGIFCVSAYLFCTRNRINNANVNVGIMSARQHTMCDECAIGWPVHRARSGVVARLPPPHVPQLSDTLLVGLCTEQAPPPRAVRASAL